MLYQSSSTAKEVEGGEDLSSLVTIWMSLVLEGGATERGGIADGFCWESLKKKKSNPGAIQGGKNKISSFWEPE